MSLQIQIHVAGSNTRGTITRMHPSTTYNCTIYAVTEVDGPASNPITVTTLAGMTLIITACMHVATYV